MAYTQDNLYFSVSTPFGADKLLLKSFQGEERLSEPFHFRLEMQSEDADLAFDSIVGEHATIEIQLADESTRFIDGIVSRFVQAASDTLFTTYFAELRPWFWLLTQSADCRIFQNQTVPAIIEAVFSDHGFSDYKNELTGTYAAREYTVQYNETAFAFVSRLLEDEGIGYFFRHEDGKHTMILADAASSFQTCSGADKVAYGTHGVWTQQNVVTRCSLEENVISSAVALDDFNFETPSTDLMVEVESTVSTASAGNGQRRVYSYPGGFVKKNDGDGRAKLGIEGREVGKRWLSGDSFCRAFYAGAKTTLEEHPRTDVNDSYVVAGVVHHGAWEGYSNRFEAFPATVSFRPRNATPRPTIASTQTAIVVGKKGEEIWTDKYGRVKVQFHWDQLGKLDENSSCWIRVAHGWAGKSWGQIFIPRIGQEVVVSFLNGDPDRPLITGSVYNAEQTVPYTLPAEQTKSTMKSDTSKGSGGYNELRFEDKKDSEEVYFQAEKDFNRVVKNNDTLKVGFEKKDEGNQTIDVYNDRTTTIDQGNDTLTVKTGDRIIKVDTGNETHDVEGTRDVTVTGKVTHVDKDDFDQTVDKNYTLTVKGDLTIDVTGKVTIKSGGAMLFDSKATLTGKAATSLTQQAGTSLENKAGTALTNKAGANLTNDASANLTNKAGAVMTNQASASQTVDGGGALVLKGGAIKIN